MTQTLALARKELKAYFGSPMAAIFIGAFLLASLFSFFWLESFFSRNLADIRPLFRWMPLLLLFLAAALTMRQWSEEQKMGTMEVLLTLPVPLSRLVGGKFLAVLALVGLALALTLGLPVTVALLGELDWGPVMGGYLGALLMASAYIAIGLFVSSRTDNQIIALIGTVLLSTLFYLPGASGITSLLGNTANELFRSLGTGSRFMSIERGVIDLRDLVYYLSITLFFLALNTASLASQRWSRGERSNHQRRAAMIGMALLGANLLIANLWLAKAHPVRLDLTQHHEFSISQPTRDLIENLPEPLELRGYFSDKTHPLLAPLAPRIRDLMEEYRIASGGRISVSFIDPKYDQTAEAEANQLYGIKPVPFQVAGRYEAAVINSYFNILVRYGDQFVTLGFNDLIEAKPKPDGQMEVGLRNLEYDITKSIKKVVHGFESIDTILAKATKPMTLTLVATPGSLPGPLADLPKTIEEVATGLAKESGNTLHFVLLDPDAPGATMNREQAAQRFGIKPLAVSPIDRKEFFLHLLLSMGERNEHVFVDSGMGAAEIRQEMEAAIKRTSSGFLKTVGVWTPPPPMEMMLQGGGSGQYRFCQQLLQENYNVAPMDLKSGHVPGEVDVLLLVAPQGMSDRERLAVDQYLMQGGSVVALTGSHVLDLAPGSQTLHLKEVKEGIATLLTHYGVTVEKGLMMDRQNEPFPIPVSRDLGGVTVQEIRQMAYPFFVDVRQSGMAKENPALASLPSVTMNWVSPLAIDPAAKAKGLEPVTLLASSPDSWLRQDTTIQPDFARYPQLGFAEGEGYQSRPLAVSLKGSFASAFADQPDPRLAPAEPKEQHHAHDKEPGQPAAKPAIPLTPLVRQSPDSSRLVVVGSSEFVSDMVISISQSTGQDRILNSLGFLQNLIDWSVEDEGLLSIRSRGAHTRLLPPLSRREQAFWEWFNYGLALAALLLVAWHGSRRHQREEPMELDPA